MGENKISFSFVKSVKKPLLEKQLLQEKKVEYIACLDEKAIKVIGEEEKKKEPLVIPLSKTKTWHDRIINKINADIFKQKAKNKNDVSNIQQAVSNIQIKTIAPNENESILDELAAKEIIEDLKSIEEKDKLSDLTLPLIKGQNLNGAEESLLKDYENVPIEEFGTAMLRGMGWKSGEGIGKNPKLVTTIIHEVRPAGMGLGADKIALQKLDGKVKKEEEEELKIEKGSFIKIIAGKRANTYGQIEGFDDAGRLIIKMALNGNTISVNECIVQAVTKAEYLKNSKVLNAAKYEEHKNKEANKQKYSDLYSNDESDLDTFERKSKHKKRDSEHKTKKSKERQRNSSDNDSDNKKDRKRRRSNSSDRVRKAKKSKKHKEKDKERERQNDKISEPYVKRKSKKHRSRSSSRR